MLRNIEVIIFLLWYRKYLILGNETIHCFINNNDYKSVHTKGGTSQNHPLFL